MKLSFITAALAAAGSVQYTPDQLGSEITDLPDLPADAKDKFKMFSGYISVSDSPKRALFYWFVESQRDPSSDPVLLWSNGGPGCSGLGGFMTEQGPFRPTENGTLIMNDFSWNKLANVVFIEQPAGVGFSTISGSGFKYGDEQAAQDNYQFVKGFFAAFPQYAKSPFYTTSESYGGHYMPTLAQEIVKQGGVPNYKGFMVGNPLTYMPYRNLGQYGTYRGHNMLPQPLWAEYEKNNCQKIDAPDACDKIVNSMDDLVSDVDPYALDFPNCGGPLQAGMHERYTFMRKIKQSQAAVRSSKAVLGTSLGGGKLGRYAPGYFPADYEPCDKDWGNKYLNRADVQAAIHVQGSVKWSDCSNSVGDAYNVDDVNAPMMPVYKYLINQTKQPLNIHIYSGDDDSICATEGTQQFIWDLGISVKKPWSAWSVAGDKTSQLAGYTTQFDSASGFRFSTVHGAGHMTPATRPAQTLDLLRRYLTNDF